MEETLKLATWNVQGAFSDLRRAGSVLDEIEKSGADIISVPDAWYEDADAHETLQVTAADFRRRGFTALKASSEEDRTDDTYTRRGLMTIINSTVAPAYEEIRLGPRPAHHLRLMLGGQAVSIVSLHLSELNDIKRLEQITDLENHLEAFPLDAIALAGDFNAMHTNSVASHVLNTSPVRNILQFLPTRHYTVPLITRMASGIVMRRLEDEGYTDCDPLQQPTMPSEKPLFQLSHIMTRTSPTIYIAAGSPEFVRRPYLSDHLMVTSTLDIKKL